MYHYSLDNLNSRVVRVCTLQAYCRINPNCTGWVKVDVTNFDVKLRKKFLLSFFFKCLFLQKYFAIFFELHNNIRNWCFDIHFNDLTSKIRQPPFHSVLLFFKTISRQKYYGLQSGAVPVSIPIRSVLNRLCEVAGPKLSPRSCSFQVDLVILVSSRNSSTLLHTWQQR